MDVQRTLTSLGVILLLALIVVPIAFVGTVNTLERNSTQNVKTNGFSYDLKFSLELFRATSLTIRFPTTSINHTIALTGIGLFGGRDTDQRNISASEDQLTLSFGKYEIKVSFVIPNQLTPESSFPNLLSTDYGFQVSLPTWLLLAALVALPASAIMSIRGFAKKSLVGSWYGRELVSLSKAIDREIVEKDLSSQNILERYKYQKNGFPNTFPQQFDSVREIDNYIPSLRPEDREKRELRAALLLLSFIQLVRKFKHAAQQLRPYWVLFLSQTAERTVIKTAYTQEAERFIENHPGFPDLEVAKLDLSVGEKELEKASSWMTLSKVIYTGFVAVSITLLLPASPASWTLVKALILAYLFTNFLVFFARWSPRGLQK